MIPKLKKIELLVQGGIIAVIRRLDPEVAVSVADALVSGGVTALEVTVDSQDFFNVIRKLSQRYGDKAVVGAGTVLDGHSAYNAINSGAEFVFCPTLSEDTIRTALRYGKIVIPGVMTPTEALTAMELGADAVKIFPAATVGSKFFKDLSAPLPQIPMIPTGGVNLDNIADYIKAGAIAAGVGGSLVDKKAVASGDYKIIKLKASEFVKKVQDARTIGN
jgi:2-dehydro-3-deoxyphosphogluconate aldolase/(4S)-4-hydroxy-2-oxoglutarate aldolase